MKKIIKKIMPTSLWLILRTLKARYLLALGLHYQGKRFFRSYAKESSTSLSCLQTRTVFYAHQIEKGLSHKDFRYGFGRTALTNLSFAMKRLENVVPDARQNDNSYRVALATIHEYIQRHRQAKYDLTNIKCIFTPEIWCEAEQYEGTQGGSYAIDVAVKKDNKFKTFKQLAESRHAVREYSEEPVTVSQIHEAVNLARTAPSVCNRQPARVHVTFDSRIITEALNIQGGFRGYATPPALILVTADNQAFLYPSERNEGFVDGGLFAMQLLMSLESVGLAACPLNTMMDGKSEQATRALMHVPDTEFLVMYIAVGHFPNTINLCRSTRLPVNAIMSTVE
ncbi:nitroreductase family protein [Bifidobacterium phasiani]|uniref:Nitroreductase family protein n=1 Tax=Bifidobacterium phasiani TaxID=2834431 RepID=A0ABS6W7Z9_9BIFI|nr:nitroreductase family protein [Bifidobacterium phasiani]MBW3082611.1 nitroreductase family protein [Bifidobacterium phasiani]